MTEKRFTANYQNSEIISVHDKGKLINIEQMVECLNQLHEENQQLKSKNRGLQSELQIFKEDITHSNLQINKLVDENEQLKKDATTLICSNQEYRRKNDELKKIYYDILKLLKMELVKE